MGGHPAGCGMWGCSCVFCLVGQEGGCPQEGEVQSGVGIPSGHVEREGPPDHREERRQGLS